MHHYLPAYLLHALAHPESLVLQFSLYQLVPSAKEMADDPQYHHVRFDRFSEEQRHAVGAYLSHVYSSGLFTGSEPSIERAAALWPNVA